MLERQSVIVTTIGVTQTLAWGSTYYLPAILADPMAESLKVSRGWIFGAFSASLLIAAVAGPAVGRFIDRHGGKHVLVVSNAVFAAGLAALATVDGLAGLFCAWAVLGLGMALGLYDAAFATLTRLYGQHARSAITGITLIAGFASTVGWPLTALFEASYGWRPACLIWAALHIVLAAPANAFLIPRATVPSADHAVPRSIGWEPRKPMLLLAFVFAASWFVTGAMAAHLPNLLERCGATALQAISAGALVGPAQVAARFLEFMLLRRVHPLVSAQLATVLHPAGAVLLIAFGAPMAAIFALLHGAGNGLLTIARGTVPLALFGPVGYGHRTGLLGAPARAAQAAAPLLFGLLLDWLGPNVLFVSGGLCLLALIALLILPTASAAVSPFQPDSPRSD